MSSHASARAAGQAGPRGRAVRAVANTALVGLAAGSVTMATVQVAQAATPPVAPNNIVIFPQRDFVTLEGYEARAGQTATVVVTRAGVQTSRAVGTIGAGDPSLEINHPGGICWQNVTPDIKPGDLVTVRFSGGGSDSARTLSPVVTSVTPQGTADLVITGRRAANVPLSQMEQRIVAPDLKDTAVGRRDTRAPARPGPYTATLTAPTASTFRAQYHFVGNDPATPRNEATEMRDIAAAGQARALSWQATNAAGDRQGLTIAEFGEVGGPGMGGCPTGPETKAPDAPASVTATAGNGSVTASWSAATTIPDSPAVTGYRVTAVSSSGLQTSVNAPVCTTVCSATVPNLVNGDSYQVQVRAVSAAGDGAAGVAGPVSPVGGAVQPPASVTALDGATGDAAFTASVTWTAPVQPAGVTVDGWRVTAFNAVSNARIKRVFMDETVGATDATRTRDVAFAGEGSVFFRVQAISADDAGTLSALSPASNTVLAR